MPAVGSTIKIEINLDDLQETIAIQSRPFIRPSGFALLGFDPIVVCG